MPPRWRWTHRHCPQSSVPRVPVTGDAPSHRPGSASLTVPVVWGKMGRLHVDIRGIMQMFTS